MKQKIKKIPRFKNEDEEREFWNTHDSTEYVNYSHAIKMSFPNLKPTDPDKIKKIKEENFPLKLE